MKLLAIDFETQDDKPLTTRITEVGACLMHTHEEADDQGEPKRVYGATEVYSQLCYEPDYPPQEEFIVDITGITDEMLKKDGQPRKHVFVDKLIPLVESADVIFAHKKNFDQTIFESTCKALGLDYPKDKRWICTLSEFQWPRKYTCHKLGHLAFEHGVFDCEEGEEPEFDRTKMHRAGDDAKLLLHLITKYYHLDDVLAYAAEPWIYFKADILPPWKDGGAQKEVAFKLGFSYERCKHTEGPVWPKSWVRRVKLRDWSHFKAKIADAKVDFRITKIEGL